MYKRYYDIDVDAKAYANRIVKAGGRIPSDIGSVSDFIRRLKQNNLYTSVADMWFLRSEQNIGYGSTFYSLKNSNNPCTLINGPTIGRDGIRTAAASSQYLKITTPEILNDFTVFIVGTNIINASSARIFCFQKAGSSYLTDSISPYYVITSLILTMNYTDGNATTTSDGGYATTAYGFQSFAISASPTIGVYRRSNAVTSNFTASARRPLMKNVIYCGGIDSGGSVTSFSNFVYSAVFLFSPNIENNYTNIYNTYKATAGKGLGLP
jgi:hypothetical protein